jgi:hypothetical protein
MTKLAITATAAAGLAVAAGPNLTSAPANLQAAHRKSTQLSRYGALHNGDNERRHDSTLLVAAKGAVIIPQNWKRDSTVSAQNPTCGLAGRRVKRVPRCDRRHAANRAANPNPRSRG